MEKDLINDNYNFFQKNIDTLSKKYFGEYIVISNKEVIHHSKSLDEVVSFSKKLDKGTFIIQKCGGKQFATYYSRVGLINEQSKCIHD